MTDVKKNSNADPLDDLFEAEPSNPAPSSQVISDEAKEDVKRATAHVRARGLHAAQRAHERAKNVRANLPGIAKKMRSVVASEWAKPTDWRRRIAPPMLIVSALAIVVLAAALTIDNPSRPALDAPVAHPAVAIAVQQSPVASPSISNAPVSVPVATATVATPAPGVPDLVPTPSTASVAPASSTPAQAVASPTPASSLPPVPREANAGTCAIVMPTLNEIFALKRSLTAEEKEWIRFGYDCLGRGRLTADASGFALPAKVEMTEDNTPVAKPHPKASEQSSAAKETPKAKRSTGNHTGGSAGAPESTPNPVPSVATITQTTIGDGTCVLRGTVRTIDGAALPNASVQVLGSGSARFETQAMTDATGTFSTDHVPTSARVRVVLRTRGYLDDARETTGCAPVALTAKKSNPLSSLFDAARRADRSIQGAAHGNGG